MQTLRFKKKAKKKLIVQSENQPVVYAYLRGSLDSVHKDNQRFELDTFCQRKSILVNFVVEETISGAKRHDERQLGGLLKKMQPGDTLIVSDLSRLARNMMNLMEILSYAMQKGIHIKTIKEGYELGDNISSKVLAFAFGLAADIERQMISERTKAALARKKAEGVILGRPKGSKSAALKADPYKEKIIRLRKRKISKSAIGRICGLHRLTVDAYMKANDIT